MEKLLSKKRLLMAFVIAFIILIPPVVLAERVPTDSDPGAVTTMEVEEVVKPRSVLIRESLTRTKKPKATNGFWDKLAVCETNSNWQDGGKWAGGLGIYQGTWENFGGTEFAPSPGKATKKEQIIVAHRISTQGYKTVRYRDPKRAKIMGVPAKYVWEKEPVGFGGWGCYKSKSTGLYRMEKPKLYYHDTPRLVPFASFSMNERSALVKDLQTWLRVTVDGHYGAKTRRAHLRWLKKRGHSTEGVPPLLHNGK
jgi:hypothetical protein